MKALAVPSIGFLSSVTYAIPIFMVGGIAFGALMWRVTAWGSAVAGSNSQFGFGFPERWMSGTSVQLVLGTRCMTVCSWSSGAGQVFESDVVIGAEPVTQARCLLSHHPA